MGLEEAEFVFRSSCYSQGLSVGGGKLRLELKVLGFRVSGLGFRVSGLGFRV